MRDDVLPEPEDTADRLRAMPVGSNDPNIVGNVGPTDVPPGADPPQRTDEDEQP